MSARFSSLVFLAISVLLNAVTAYGSVHRGDSADLHHELREENNKNNAPSFPVQRNLSGAELFDDANFERILWAKSQRRRSQSTNDECVEDHDVDYFDIEVRLQPQSTPTACAAADAILLGHDINNILWDHGVGAAGEDDQAVFVAGVCPQPSVVSTTRRLTVPMQPSGFVYSGGGGCTKFCWGDNSDSRFLRNNFDGEQSHLTTRKLATDWFENTFKPQLEGNLTSAIQNDIVPKYEGCLGANVAIEVTVVGLSSWSEIDASCSGSDDGNIPLLKTFNLADILLNLPQESSSCETCNKIDFSTMSVGEYVGNQYVNDFGVNIYVSAFSCYAPNSQGRIFDTSNPSLDDLDMGSPNEECPGGGPGKGYGGFPEQGGENCIPVGNVLIIQEDDASIPNDCGAGGRIKLEFDKPVLFSDIGFMDIDETTQKIIFTYSDGSKKTFTFNGYGDNGVQRVIANQNDVVVVKIFFPGSGAITEFNFCPECG